LFCLPWPFLLVRNDVLPEEPQLQTLEIEPQSPASASVIWMHGLGADARDFYGIPAQLELPAEFNIRYVFPNAPLIPVTINMGMVMRAWYDITGLGDRGHDEKRIRESTDGINELIEREILRGVPANRIVLAGFSQGGAMALFSGVHFRETLAGVMCLSGYLLLPDALKGEVTETSRSLSIFQAHGTSDGVVPLELGRDSRDGLREAGFHVDWHEYPMAHQVCDQELRDVSNWLVRVLKS